jgi:tripartite-type tricarboxylate transporter receptor subunit TctC
MSTLVRVLCLLGVLAWPGALAAQELPSQFPSRPIRFVVPFPAGGPSDFISRVLTEKMATLLGGPIVIENRAGAGGMTGIASVAKSSPDGYTIAIAPSSQLAMNINLRESMPFHPIKDLALLTQIVSVPEILVVNKTVPAKTLADFVALAKAQPGKIVFASTGVGGMPHLAMELLELTADIKLVHVPYTGAAPAVNDLLGNRVACHSPPP